MSIHEYCRQEGKVRHVTRAKAQAVTQQMCRKHKNRTTSGELHPYRCNCCHGCHGWHVGHAVKEIA